MQPFSYRLFLAYQGSSFSGFQCQLNAKTVQSVLQKALKEICGIDCQLEAAGRTDAGVHANGQVVSFDLATKLSQKQLTLALATKLPSSVSVWRIDKFPLGFDARRQSVGKQYIYQIHQGLVQDPFLAHTSWHIRQPLDIEAMKEACSFFIGEHDFSSFRAKACTAAHAKRYIWHFELQEHNQLLKIDIRGNAFCQNMVRIMVGTLVHVGLKKIQPNDIKTILEKKDRRLAGVTAKPQGLFLQKVYYPDDLACSKIPDNAHFPRYPVNSATWPFEEKDILYGPIN